MTDFTKQVISIIKSIPSGKVMSYGQIAAMAGNPKAARQVSWVLRSSSGKYNLPWHRVINSKGSISLHEGNGGSTQRDLLALEGIEFSIKGTIPRNFFWNGEI